MKVPISTIPDHTTTSGRSTGPARRALLGLACLLPLATAALVGGRPAAAQDATGVSVLTLNPGGLGDPNNEGMKGVPWRTRFERVAAWAHDKGVVPDVIAMTELWGWHACLGVGFVNDYGAVDHLLAKLRDKTGITYRVAFMTGAEEAYTLVGACHIYWSQALLYNPARLTNLTAQDLGRAPNLPHDSRAAAAYQPHIRRSLPLCNPGTPVMPLATLIDGPPQTDKCGRPPPSGPAWAVLWQGPGFNRIVASAARFGLKAVPGKTADVFVTHLLPGVEATVASTVRAFISKVEQPVGSTLRYPPLVVGDFNTLAHAAWDNRFEEAYLPPTDVVGAYVGRSDQFPAQCRARPVQFPDSPEGGDENTAPDNGLTVPTLDPGKACQGTAANLVSDHCGAFARVEPDGADACALRDVFVAAPSQVAAGRNYTMTAVPAGGGPGYGFLWQPSGTTTASKTAKAGAGGTTQTWTAQATDLGSGLTKTRSVSVTAIDNACTRSCANERAACLGDGIPAATCEAGYQACLADCGL